MASGAGQSCSDPVFLSLISLPEGMSAEEAAEIVGRESSLDTRTMRYALKKTPPCIISRVPAVVAREALAALKAHGGDGFAPSMADIESLGPTLKIKDMRLESGGVVFDLWRGPTITLVTTDIDFLIRVHLSDASTAPPQFQTLPSSLSYTNPTLFSSSYSWGMGGAYGASLAVYATVAANYVAYRESDRITTISHKLDIHAKDGRVFQVDGDKFGYRILGDQRGHSDNVNIDHMCELFAHLNPEAVVDPYFSFWKPPPGYKLIKIPMMKINKDDPAFAFYSRWSALMYRHVMGTGH